MWHAVLIIIGCLRTALAARAWEDISYGGRRSADGAKLQLEEESPDECHVRFGDTFHAVSELLVPLDLIWFCLAVFLVLVVILWMRHFGLHMDDTGVRKLEATKWYQAAFASLTSHAAGIVGFVGFQKIVVARIVSASDICNWWSLSNFLLYTTLALSIVGMSASFVFLGVDYTRRLVIDAAKQQGHRLMLKPKMLEHTGFGRAILGLAALMLLLYLLVIYEEAKKNTIFQKWLLLDTVCGSATVVLFYINLRGLYRSPKVQFDTTSHSANEDITLEEFLAKHSHSNSQRQNSLATFLEWAAGEDLALLATRGTRQALFPNQRFTPLLHVVCGLLLLGAFPITVQFAAQSLFTDPELQELKALTGSLAKLSPDNESTGAFDVWEFLNMKKSKKQQRFLFLTSDAASLQVTPVYRYTSSVELCCPLVPEYDCNKQRQKLHHSVIRFFKEPLVITLPRRMLSNLSTDCNLSLHGLSKRSVTHVSVRVEPKKEHGLCDCSLVACQCCDGYVNLTFANLVSADSNYSLKLLNDTCSALSCESISNTNGKNGEECACEEGYVGNVWFNGTRMTGHCCAAPCNFFGSNNQSGSGCKCRNGFAGEAKWKQSGWKVDCFPSICDISNSNRNYGLACRCNDGFSGNITWNGSIPTGTCAPAPCNIENSNKRPGPRCRCKNRYTGQFSWHGPKVTGQCEPAKCHGERLNGRPGEKCRCADGYAGKPFFKFHYQPRRPQPGSSSSVFFDRGEFIETCTPPKCPIPTFIGCTPAECTIPNSIGKGPECRCADKFVGNITWKGALVSGRCVPAACKIFHSNNKPGPDCACAFGYESMWPIWQPLKTAGLVGNCQPIPCVGDFSNHQDGPGCRCADGYRGTIQPVTIVNHVEKRFSAAGPARSNVTVFKADSCMPAKCDVENTIGDGTECRCKDGYQGSVTWIGPKAVGACQPAHCSIDSSNGKPGLQCSCLDGYHGSISWKREVPFGECIIVPCRIPHSDFAEGPFCHCLKGFYGAIKWRRNESEGECLPTPKCSQNIVHATSLARRVEDGHGNFYDAGEKMVLYGHECGHQRIQWTSFEDARGRRTRSWAWDNTTCGFPIRDDKDKDLGSIFSQMPPLECSIEAAEPRCDPDIEYRITSQDTAPYTCPDSSGREFQKQNYSYGKNSTSESSVAQYGSVLEYLGRQCGYDLILWEYVNLQSPTCLVKLPLSCGEIPDGMHLPRSCKNIGMPATFVGLRKATGENAEDGEAGTVEGEIPENYLKYVKRYVVKFFENGEYSVEGVQNGTLSWHNGWTERNGDELEYLMPDERFVSVQMPHRKSAEVRGGGGFIARDGGDEQLVAVGALPVWWTFKFQPDRMLRGFDSGFNMESLDSCHLHFFSNGTCYEIWVGMEAKVSRTSDSSCPTQAGTIMEKEPEEYYFEFSTYVTQTYRSENSCASLAAYRELEFEIFDVGSQNVSSSSSSSSLSSASSVVVSECRIALRLAFDASSLGCRSFDSYVKEYGYDG